MGNEAKWNKLLDDPFFKHIEGDFTRDVAQRLLTFIGEEFYQDKFPPGIDYNGLVIPESNSHKESIGFKAEVAWRGLKELLNATGEAASGTGEDIGWTHQFLSDQNFQACVFQMLDSLSARAQRSLPDREHLPSMEARAKAAAQDNTEDLRDEIKKAEAASQAADDSRKAAEKAKATADSIMPNMLTTLGVFIAIVIAVVGCYLSVLLTHYAQDAKTINMTMVLLMGHILLNIIFLLLYLISKMSAHSLACHCLIGDRMDCQECDPALREQCHLRHKLWLRYPYVVAMNGTFIAAYCVLGLWHLVSRYFGDNIDHTLKNNWIYAVAVIATVAILIIAAGVFVFRFFSRSPRRKAEKMKAKARKEELRAQKKEQNTARERKSVHELRDKLRKQEERIATLERTVETLTEVLEQYTQEKDNAPTK